ncbi:MAG: aldo/keto reductase [Polyangiaceae bacterium]|nr:aldo/keto reductase [Polyangiaceae bacterium]
MRRRSLGWTGLELTELTLGTWGLSGDGYGPVDEATQDRVIERALALGLACFETAASYGQGAMERRLARHLRGIPEAVIVTKLGTFRDGSPPRKSFDREYLTKSFEQSAERLGRDVVDIVLLHNPSLPTVEHGEATETLAGLQAAGRLRAWGVSAGTPEVARAALGRGAAVVSLAFNVFHSAAARSLTEQIATKGAGMLAHSALAYGLLAGLWPVDRVFVPGDHRADRWTPDELRQRIRQLDAIRPLVDGKIPTLRGAALRWVLTHQYVSSVILGPRSVLQLDQLVREVGRGPTYLTRAQTTALAARLRDVGIEA